MLSETVLINNDDDLINCRILAGNIASLMGFDELDRIRITTAVSEIVRNVLTFAENGKMEIIKSISDVKIIITDQGEGIKNIEAAMVDGYSSIGSLGIGLPGAKRLVDEFNIESINGEGTVVTLIKKLKP